MRSKKLKNTKETDLEKEELRQTTRTTCLVVASSMCNTAIRSATGSVETADQTPDQVIAVAEKLYDWVVAIPHA